MVEGREIRRSEVVARTWAAQDQIVSWASEQADRIDELAPLPHNAEFRVKFFDQLALAYGRGDEVAFLEALANLIGRLTVLEET